MTRVRTFGAAPAVFLLVGLLACSDDEGLGPVGGSSGTGGSTGAVSAFAAGLWEGQSEEVDVCLFVSEDGRRLTADARCNLATRRRWARSYDLRVDLGGSDQDGQPCSFELRFTDDVPIDPRTGAFHVSGVPVSGDDAEVSFSGQLTGEQASGIAQLRRGATTCTAGWAASRSAPCDDAAIDTCFALLQCCRSILVNPVFFQACNSVVLQCDQTACQELLDGYPRCVEREPENGSEAASPASQ